MHHTALVAGGAGFIGAHLCKSLLEENFKVICVDNLITGDKKNIEGFKNNPNFLFFHQDVVSPLNINESIDFIFHLASPASPNIHSKRSYINFPLETLRVNSEGTYQLLELAKIKKSKFLFTSTSEVYGDPLESPQKETYFGNVNPNGLRSVYDESKRFGEAMTMTYYRKFGLDARIIRIFNTYGPLMQADDGRVVSNFVVSAINNKPLTIYGDGKQTRSFCFVDDMVIGIKKAMFTNGTNSEVINLGNTDERTVLNLGEIIVKITDSKSQIIFNEKFEDDPKIRKPDISKAKKLLDWEPTTSLEDGLTKTIEYFRGL